MGGVAPSVEFRAQMTRLMGLKFAPSELVTHWEALRDVSADVLDAAVTKAQKTRSEFPSPVELRQDCDAVAHLVRPIVDEDRGVELAEPFTVTIPQAEKSFPITREWKYYHEACSDSGTESLWCGSVTREDGKPNLLVKPWHLLQACERAGDHQPHEWVRRCRCWESNPALIAKRDRQQRYAETKTRGAA